MQIVADKLVCKEEGDPSKGSLSTGPVDLKYSTWMRRHYYLLQKQGQLGWAPEGCNPEAGRSLGSALTSSEREVHLFHLIAMAVAEPSTPALMFVGRIPKWRLVLSASQDALEGKVTRNAADGRNVAA